MNRQIKSGEGWRLGWNSTAENFTGLVAGNSWAIELTTAEFSDFRRAVLKLAATMTDMSAQLMDEETLTCEQETATIWLEAKGFPTEYSLRFILLSGRGAEGEWPPSVIPALLTALAQPPFSTLA